MEISTLHQLFLNCSSVTTDTRNIEKNSLFFALKGDNFDGNKYAQTSAFSSNEPAYEVWMVTNGVNLPSGTSPTLTFGTNDGFYNGDALTVKISTDFTGNVNSATWTNLNATFSSGHTSGYGDNFISSGDIDLSAYAGQVIYIGFQYLGSTNGVTSTYQIDNISIIE